MGDILDTGREHGSSCDGICRLSTKPEPFSTELLGWGWCSWATPVDHQADDTSQPYRREDQPGPMPMEEGVEDCHTLPYLNTPHRETRLTLREDCS